MKMETYYKLMPCFSETQHINKVGNYDDLMPA